MSIHLAISHFWLWSVLIWVVCAFVAAIAMSISSGAGVEATAYYLPLMLLLWPASLILSIVVAPFALMDLLETRLAIRRHHRTDKDDKMEGSL